MSKFADIQIDPAIVKRAARGDARADRREVGTGVGTGVRCRPAALSRPETGSEGQIDNRFQPMIAPTPPHNVDSSSERPRVRLSSAVAC